MITVTVKRGEIYYADLSPVIGSEQGGTRPVLIVQNDVGNKFSPTVIAAAITSQRFKTIKKAYGNKKDVWIWTGYVVDKNLPQTSSTKEIFKNADVIVDGPFIIEEQDVTLPYAGSKNQRVLHRGKDF